MEPERPKVDRAVLDFVKATVFDPADFTIRSDGVVQAQSAIGAGGGKGLGIVEFTTQRQRSTLDGHSRSWL